MVRLGGWVAGGKEGVFQRNTENDAGSCQLEGRYCCANPKKQAMSQLVVEWMLQFERCTAFHPFPLAGGRLGWGCTASIHGGVENRVLHPLPLKRGGDQNLSGHGRRFVEHNNRKTDFNS